MPYLVRRGYLGGGARQPFERC
eukprot:SAG31_NODE_39658_length_286_cov_1.358289_1_plen_21_part_10